MRKYTKRFACFFLTLLIVSTCGLAGFKSIAFNKNTADTIYSTLTPDALQAKAYAVAYFDSGTVVIKSERADEHFSVGNLIKLMTLYLTFEAIDKGETFLENSVGVSKNAQAISEGRERVYLDAGKREVITVAEAVTAVCVASANDAAYALAEHVSKGSEANFVEMMNAKAAELGMTNTNYTDCTGIATIENGQYSCAADLAILSYHLVNNYPDVLKFTVIMSGMFQHTSTGQPETEMRSSNALISSGMYPECDGLLVGYSKEDLYAQAATSEKDGERVAAVVIGEETPERRAGELKFLLEYAIRTFQMSETEPAGTYVRQISVKDGKSLKVKTATGNDFSYLENAAETYTIEKKIVLNVELHAPVKKGDVVGTVVYQKVLRNEDGEKTIIELGTVDLVADEDVEKAGWFTLFIRKILSWLGIGDY